MISVPFAGNKRYSYKYVKEIVQEGGYSQVFEPFGGSCVLSVNLKRDGCVQRAVANDYDHFFDLYPEYLDLKDMVVEECYAHGLKRTSHDSTGNYMFEPDGTKVRIPPGNRILQGEQRQFLQDLMEEKVPKKFWRYFVLGSNFTFSAVAAEDLDKIKKRHFKTFSAYLKTDRQRAYLEALNDIELEHLDYKDFIQKHYKAINSPDTLLLIDPPYYQTYQKQYNGQFTEEETLRLVNILKDLTCDFVFFTHDKDDAYRWFGDMDCDIGLTGNTANSANKKRKDVMVFVKRNREGLND